RHPTPGQPGPARWEPGSHAVAAQRAQTNPRRRTATPGAGPAPPDRGHRPGPAARRIGKIAGAGGPLPASPNPAVTGDPAPATSTETSEYIPDGRVLGVPWTRQPTGVPGGSPTGPRTKVHPRQRT